MLPNAVPKKRKAALTLLRRWQLKVWPRGDCWEWRGAKMGNGYGVFWDGIATVPAHAFGWESAGGLMPIGSTDFDHLCRHRWCVRPSHLEPVTRKENLHRGEHPSIKAWRVGTCMRGHTDRQLRRNGKYQCRECARQNYKKRMADPLKRAANNAKQLARWHRWKARRDAALA